MILGGCMNYQFNGSDFVENIKKYANETVIARICEKLAGENGEFGEVRTWRNNFTKWKNGDSQPRAEDLIRISEVCRCGVDDLLGISSHRNSERTSTYDLLTVIDAMVEAGIAKLDVFNEGTEANLDLILPDEDDLLEYIKVCNVKIYNKHVISMLENYNHVTDLQKNADLGDKMKKALFDHEKEKSSSLGELSSDDVEISYTTMSGKPFVE